MNYVIIFFVALISLMVWSSEDERTDPFYLDWLERANERHNGLTDEENWALRDSLWELINGDSIMVKKK